MRTHGQHKEWVWVLACSIPATVLPRSAVIAANDTGSASPAAGTAQTHGSISIKRGGLRTDFPSDLKNGYHNCVSGSSTRVGETAGLALRLQDSWYVWVGRGRGDSFRPLRSRTTMMRSRRGRSRVVSRSIRVALGRRRCGGRRPGVLTAVGSAWARRWRAGAGGE